MKKSLIILLLLIIAGFTACKKDVSLVPPEIDPTIYNNLVAGGGTTSFQRIITGKKISRLYSVRQTIDGGYIFFGTTENEGAPNEEAYLLKTNAKGETTWSKKFPNTNADQGQSVEITSDNGFILATNYRLIKTDSLGNKQWEQAYPFGIAAVKQTSDGGYAICGRINGKGLLFKADASGIEIWSKAYGSTGRIVFEDMNKTADGGFIICAYKQLVPAHDSYEYIVRTNSIGDTLWTKTFGDSLNNITNSIKETTNGNFILCGRIAGWYTSSGFVQLLNSSGGQIWNINYLNINNGFLHSIDQTSDQQFISCGVNSNFSGASLQKIDSLGNSIWLRTFNPGSYPPEPTFYEVQRTSDNGFIIVGTTTGGDAYIVKTDANGN